MKKYLAFLSILFGFSKAYAQGFGSVQSAVAFIYVEDSLKNPTPNGTCFFVGIDQGNKRFPFLVTCKHVLLDKKNGGFFKEILVRINTVDSNYGYTVVKLDASGPNKNIFYPTDPSIDLAVIPFLPLVKKYELKLFDSSHYIDRAKFNQYQFQVGTETMFTGLFVPFTGAKRNYPITRFGHIALMPEEKIDWIDGKSELILVETSSYGGNSGSPIFFRYQNFTILGGVVTGMFRDVGEIKYAITGGTVTPFALYNNGISAVIPIYLLRDLLYSKQLVDFRNKF